MDKTLISRLFWHFHRAKSENATQNSGEKYNKYLTISGQNIAF
jgi:hypothetical protein